MIFDIAEWEVMELCEQLALRPTLWVGRESLWVRKSDGENYYAVKFVPSSQLSTEHVNVQLYSAYVKPLHPRCGEDEAVRYTMYLLRKLTSYGWRENVEACVSLLIPEETRLSKRELALILTRPALSSWDGEGREDIVKRSQLPEVEKDFVEELRVPFHAVSAELHEVEPVSAELHLKQIDKIVRPLSRHLRNLIKRRVQ